MKLVFAALLLAAPATAAFVNARPLDPPGPLTRHTADSAGRFWSLDPPSLITRLTADGASRF